jgi:NAD(P)-dependent dehydrogenase (short-subunit alcohol dehydrogenase family)
MLAILTVYQELSKSLQSKTGKLYAIKCDVTKNSDIETAFKWVRDTLGGVDILVNNAGVAFNSPLVGKSSRKLLVVLMDWFYSRLRKIAKSVR